QRARALAASQRDRHFMSLLRNKCALVRICDHEPIRITNHRLKFLECFTLAHNRGHFFEPPNKPAVVSPVFERELLHSAYLNRGPKGRKAARAGSSPRAR